MGFGEFEEFCKQKKNVTKGRSLETYEPNKIFQMLGGLPTDMLSKIPNSLANKRLLYMMRTNGPLQVELNQDGMCIDQASA